MRPFTAISIFSFFFLGLSVIAQAAPSPSIPCFQASGWCGVDLVYTQVIDKKTYTERVNLLRSQAWIADHHVSKPGDHLVLSLPEFGIDRVTATVTAIFGTSVDPQKLSEENPNARTVIATFARHTTDVRAYTLQNTQSHQQDIIQATPNHPFYVINRTIRDGITGKPTHYISIGQVTSADQLISETGTPLKLIHQAPLPQTLAIPVYNMEVYQDHRYFVGQQRVLVHNNGLGSYTGGTSIQNYAWVSADGTITQGQLAFETAEGRATNAGAGLGYFLGRKLAGRERRGIRGGALSRDAIYNRQADRIRHRQRVDADRAKLPPEEIYSVDLGNGYRRYYPLWKYKLTDITGEAGQGPISGAIHLVDRLVSGPEGEKTYIEQFFQWMYSYDELISPPSPEPEPEQPPPARPRPRANPAWRTGMK